LRGTRGGGMPKRRREGGCGGAVGGAAAGLGARHHDESEMAAVGGADCEFRMHCIAAARSDGAKCTHGCDIMAFREMAGDRLRMVPPGQRWPTMPARPAEPALPAAARLRGGDLCGGGGQASARGI
jgi:hypothetical protein